MPKKTDKIIDYQEKFTPYSLIKLSIVALIFFLIGFNHSWARYGKFNTEKNQIIPINHQLDNQLIYTPAKYNIEIINTLNENGIQNQARGDISIIEFGDFTCPVSKQQHQILLDLANKYPQIKLVFHNLPQKFHKYADNESLYLFCIAENQKLIAWNTVNQLFATSKADGIGRQFNQLEEIISINEQTKTCLQNIDMKNKMGKQIAQIGESGISGTPSLALIGNDFSPLIISGLYEYDELRSLLKLN